MAAYILQLFSDKPQRPLSIYGILSGKKTASVMFAGLEQNILRWWGLAPRLTKADFLAAVQHLQRQQLVTAAGQGLVLTARGRAAQAAMAAGDRLPATYRPELNVFTFMPRLFLAVQVVSEADAGNARYVPINSDWGVQQWVRGWYGWGGRDAHRVVAELTAAFSGLPGATADGLAGQLVGHEFSGAIDAGVDRFVLVDWVAQLLVLIDAHPEWTLLNGLWGGRKPWLNELATKMVADFNAGLTLPAIATHYRRKLSTVTEHIQVAAITGTPVAAEQLLSATDRAALQAAWTSGARDYKALMAAAPALEFAQVRLFQINQIRRAQNAE